MEPKGIIASGWVTKAPFQAPHWDSARATSGEQSYFIKFTADAILLPEISPPLDLRQHITGPLSEVQTNTPASGNLIAESAAIALSHAWLKHLGGNDQSLGKGDPELGAMEGELRQLFVKHRARERALRSAKLEQARSIALSGVVRMLTPPSTNTL